jgi:hypothetical protein
VSEERLVPSAAEFASTASRATLLATNILQASLVAAVVLWVMDVPRRALGLALYTEQLLTVCLGLSLALAFVTERARLSRFDWGGGRLEAPDRPGPNSEEPRLATPCLRGHQSAWHGTRPCGTRASPSARTRLRDRPATARNRSTSTWPWNETQEENFVSLPNGLALSCEPQRLRGPLEAPKLQCQTLPNVERSSLWPGQLQRLS